MLLLQQGRPDGDALKVSRGPVLENARRYRSLRFRPQRLRSRDLQYLTMLLYLCFGYIVIIHRLVRSGSSWLDRENFIHTLVQYPPYCQKLETIYCFYSYPFAVCVYNIDVCRSDMCL